jgi:hypothetical protein
MAARILLRRFQISRTRRSMGGWRRGFRGDGQGGRNDGPSGDPHGDCAAVGCFSQSSGIGHWIKAARMLLLIARPAR